MIKIGIFGAGQAGLMVAKWLPAEQKLVGFIDNNIKKQGKSVMGVPVYSMEQALEIGMDKIWIAVLNREATTEIVWQITESGFSGEIVELQQFREKQDIRLASLRLIAEELKKRKISGDVAELGVFQGMFAAEINRLFPEKKLYLFDTFYGFDERDIEIEKKVGNRYAKAGTFSETGIDIVKARLMYPEQAVFCPGYFPESLVKNADQLPRFSFISLDPDLYEPVYEGLRFFYPRLNSGGMIQIHDYNSMQFPGVKKAVEKYCEERDIYIVPLMDLHGSAVVIKP